MDTKGVIAIGISALLVGAGVGAISFPVEKEIIKEVPFEVTKEVIKEVPVEKIITQEIKVEVPVEVQDTVLLSKMCDRLLYDDLLDCQKEIVAEDEALKSAFNSLDTTEFYDFLQDEGIVEDEDEVKTKKIYQDFEDIEILKSDFEDEQYEFKIMVKVYDDDSESNKKLLVTVTVDEGEVDFESVETIEVD